MSTLRALLGVAYQSLLYRLSGVALAITAVAISVFVLLSVEHVRHEARSSFASTVSNVDLIVGARTGEINLLLWIIPFVPWTIYYPANLETIFLY